MSIYAQYENFGLARLGLDIKTSISDAQKLKLSMMDYAKPFSPLVTCQLIKLLEESECNLGMREFCATLEDGSTRLHWVAKTNVLGLATFWSQRNNVNSRDKHGLTPLHVAALNKNWIMYNHLVSLGANEQIQNFYGVSPAMPQNRKEQLYAISKFKMERVATPFRDKVIAIIGKRGSGKTTLMKDIISNVIPKFENGVVFSPTEIANGTWGKIFPPTNVYSEFNEDAVTRAKTYQMDRKKETARRFKRQFGRPAENFDELKPFMPSFLIIFEDCFYDNTIKNNKAVRDLLMNGRHFNFFVMIALQYYLDISPGLRNQIDFAIFTKEANGETLRKLHKQAFSAMIERFSDFKRIFDRHTENRGYMILTPTANSNKAEEVIFYYKADPTTNPTIGSKALWAWAARHYLDPFGLGDDDDDDQREDDENGTVLS